MWISKLILNGGTATLGKIAKKLSMSFIGYPISIYKNNGSINVCFAGYTFAKREKIEELTELLKNSDKILNFEESNGFFIGRIKESLKLAPMYEENIIHVEPVLIKEDGTEEWTIGSWKREDLTKLAALIEKKYNGKLVNIVNKKINNLSIISTNPQLTDNQKNAMNLAIMNGYYAYPRKTDLKKLSKIFGCCYSTYQSHLRKAELKILPFVFNKKLIK
jgi:hypothetical protein